MHKKNSKELYMQEDELKDFIKKKSGNEDHKAILSLSLVNNLKPI